MIAKERLHHLVDLLPDEELAAANRFLQFLVDEAETPEDLSDEDRAEIRAGEIAIARGEFTTLDDLKRELGL